MLLYFTLYPSISLQFIVYHSLSLYHPLSPCISLYFHVFPSLSLYVTEYPSISLYFPQFPFISFYFPLFNSIPVYTASINRVVLKRHDIDQSSGFRRQCGWKINSICVTVYIHVAQRLIVGLTIRLEHGLSLKMAKKLTGMTVDKKFGYAIVFYSIP